VDLRDRFLIEHPVLQAGMGGGIAGADLAATVTNAGGLGTVGFAPPQDFDREISRTKAETEGKTYAANLLLPLTLRGHVDSLLQHKVPIVTMFYGFNASVMRAVKDSGALVIYQIGSEEEAAHVVAAGADALIVQGVEAGGHVRGKERLTSILPKVRARFPDTPVIAAGGIYDRQSASNAIAIGADGVASGTRFLMTNESGAHAAYKNLLVTGSETAITTLFGLGWPDPHRVLINEAVKRWCNDHGDPQRAIRILNWLTQFGSKYTPPSVLKKLAQAQRVDRPLFTPMLAEAGMSEPLMEALAAYAGECVSEINTLEPAVSVVESLAAGC
jgi:nitronate monooxygenase